MEQLFELLVDHIGLVIVLAAGGFAFLKKLGANVGSPSGKRPGGSMPSFGGDPGEKSRPEVYRKKEWVPSRETGEGVTMEGAANVQPETVRQSRPKEAGSGLPVPSRAAPLSSTAQSSSSSFDLALDKGDLSRAVLWAEILGPPRAKRPHGRR